LSNRFISGISHLLCLLFWSLNKIRCLSEKWKGRQKKKLKKKNLFYGGWLYYMVVLPMATGNSHLKKCVSFILLEIKYSTIDNFACDNICMATAWQDCSCYQCDYISQSVCCRANNFGTKTRQIHQDWYAFCNLFSYWDPYIF
jgi:hypothetical protein